MYLRTARCGIVGMPPRVSFIIARNLSKHLIIQAYSYTMINWLEVVLHMVQLLIREKFPEIPSQMISFVADVT